MARIEPARTQADFSITRELFEEYAARLGVDLCFQGFNTELTTLDTMYAPPQGCLLLAWRGDAGVGCVGVRKLSATVCEMKRLYVRDGLRGLGVGRQLAVQILAQARELGYSRMVLDTLEGMSEARGLYASLGFRECAPYYDNPLAAVVYMALDLSPPVSAQLTAAALKERA
ncbi:MAG: GNAT family N-acetyltransferase [Steroidobacteraceae bacterium]